MPRSEVTLDWRHQHIKHGCIEGKRNIPIEQGDILHYGFRYWFVIERIDDDKHIALYTDSTGEWLPVTTDLSGTNFHVFKKEHA